MTHSTTQITNRLLGLAHEVKTNDHLLRLISFQLMEVEEDHPAHGVAQQILAQLRLLQRDQLQDYLVWERANLPALMRARKRRQAASDPDASRVF